MFISLLAYARIEAEQPERSNGEIQSQEGRKKDEETGKMSLNSRQTDRQS